MNKAWTLGLGALVALATSAVSAQDIKGDAAAGAQKNAMCIGCHNIVGYKASFPEVYKVPMIVGQNAGYIDAALQEYKSGARKFPTMRGIAASLSDQDMANLAAFYAADGAKVEVPEKLTKAPSDDVKLLLEKGACVSCHGENFSKPISDAYPKIAGQHPDYLYVSLRAYKSPNEGPYSGRANPIMGGVASQFSNSELRSLANYIGSLDTQLQVAPEPRFR